MNTKIKKISRHVLRYCVPVYAVSVAQMLAQGQLPQADPSVALSFNFAAVMVSAWYGGAGPGLFASVLALLSGNFFNTPLESPNLAGVQIAQASAFLFAAFLISLLNSVRKRLNRELTESLAQVKLLSGLLPICSSCKMIREDGGGWSQIETYISNHSEATFTHGVCPDCYQKVFPESYEKYKQKYLDTSA